MSRSDDERVADILDVAEHLAEIASEGRSEFDENSGRSGRRLEEATAED